MKAKTKVLIVEDHADIRESAAEILELAGFDVYQAGNGKSGVQIAVDTLPHVILCDIMMPELDGFGVLHLLSKNPLTASLPFVFLTAKAERADVRKGMEMGANDYLTKPFTNVELLNVIECQLNKHHRHQKNQSDEWNDSKSVSNNGIGLEELRQKIADIKPRQLKKKQVVYYQGDAAIGLYMIVSGSVKTFKMADDGRTLSTAIYGPNEYVGVAAVLAEDEHQESAETIEDSIVRFVSKKTIDDFILRFPDVAKNFIKLLANKVIDGEDNLVHMAYDSVRKRMAQLLLTLSLKAGEQLPKQITLSRENLAAMAGMAAETVSRILTDFQDEGLIIRQPNQLMILNEEKLRRMKN